MINYKNLPQTPGVYKFINDKNKIIYIGKAINIKKRVSSYTNTSLLGKRTKQMVSQIDHIDIIQTDSEFDALLLEAKLIRSTMPKYNVIWRDDKHPLYIKITKGLYPKITTSRRENEKNATYYGPFMSSAIIRDTLRFLREIVPYCTSKTLKTTPCFYSHIGLCNPCPNQIEKLKPSEKKKQIAIYKKNIRLLKRILDGKSKQVIKDLTKDMQYLSKQEKYKEASIVKKRLEKLQYITRPRVSVKEYLTNPNLYSDLRNNELEKLALLLKIPHIRRIEGYDISNIVGTNATGSMVVFIDGEADKGSYRRFRIKVKKIPDDYAMMKEVLSRRLKHTDWPLPELFLIDGGAGQVSAVLEIFAKMDIYANVIGLAKRMEEIIVPLKTNGKLFFKKIRLKPESPELQLIQRVRDEAHRFAKAYHVKLRAKQMIY